MCWRLRRSDAGGADHEDGGLMIVMQCVSEAETRCFLVVQIARMVV